MDRTIFLLVHLQWRSVKTTIRYSTSSASQKISLQINEQKHANFYYGHAFRKTEKPPEP